LLFCVAPKEDPPPPVNVDPNAPVPAPEGEDPAAPLYGEELLNMCIDFKRAFFVLMPANLHFFFP